MRLLRVEDHGERGLTLRFQEFLGRDIPAYAILSHTWENEEVSYDDFLAGRGPSMKGYGKIMGCAKQAQQDKLDYIWVDTCCIDKRSSAELTEAINSMYAWYERSETCYAYLVDVPPKRFEQSRWFTRGWTLQELLAPVHVAFYNARWDFIVKKDNALDRLADITGIQPAFLSDFALGTTSVATRLSWASKRCTTRVEDEAYCLLGLLGVNMPLLYGEGSKAFQRLQDAILRQAESDTLLAWASKDDRLYSSPLAEGPSSFYHQQRCFDYEHVGITIVPHGLTLNTCLCGHEYKDVYLAVLGCGPDRRAYTILLLEVKDEVGNHYQPRQFFRIRSSRLHHVALENMKRDQNLASARRIGSETITILKVNDSPILRALPDHLCMLQVWSDKVLDISGAVMRIESESSGPRVEYVFLAKSGKLGAASFTAGGERASVVFGLSEFGTPWCRLLSVNPLGDSGIGTGSKAELRDYRENKDDLYMTSSSFGEVMAFTFIRAVEGRPTVVLRVHSSGSQKKPSTAHGNSLRQNAGPPANRQWNSRSR